MSRADEAWLGLDRVEKAIDTLVDRARIAREPAPAKGRELGIVLVQDVGPLVPFSYNPLEVSYYNGDERDLVIEKLTCVVYNQSQTSPDNDAAFVKCTRFAGAWNAAGFSPGAGGGWRFSTKLFDFNWNMRFDDTQARYSRDSNLSSFVLGDIQKKRYLEFARPLVVRKSASVAFLVQPTLFRACSATTDQFQVTFVGFGYRRQPERR